MNKILGVIGMKKFYGVNLPAQEADNPLRRLRCFSLALYFYAVITHFYSQGLSVDAEEFGPPD